MVDSNTFPKIPPLDQRERIPMYAIQAVVDFIAKEFNPHQIILFGSHAYGTPQPWSDVDLLIVMKTDKHPVEISQNILHALPPALFSIEIVVRSPETIQRRLNLGDPFIKEIIGQGKVLYERADS
jgi:predicted nucleotidyltransferase